MGKASAAGTPLTRRSFATVAGGTLALALARPSESRAQTPRAELPKSWRRAATLPLWPNGTPGGGFAARSFPADMPSIFIRNVEKPLLHVFRPARSNGRAVLAIPGGSYTFVSVYNEGLQIAEAMTASGYTVFVLVYRLPGEGWTDRADVPLQDAQRAVRLIRFRAGHYGIDPDQLYVLGFSAGGHLAATLATGAGEAVYRPSDAADEIDASPRACGLLYPVISHQPGVGHAESTRQLLGEQPGEDAIRRRSPALRVSAATPPLFLVHALDDPAVPVANSLQMMEAMRNADRPVELHLFEKGGHGFGLGDPHTPASRWMEAFTAWLEYHA